MSASTTTNVILIIQNARNVYSTSKQRNQTLFFKIVTGGTTDLVSHVISTLKTSQEGEDAQVLHWLIGDDQNKVEVKLRGPTCVTILKGILVTFLWIVLTPVFYLVHGIMNGLLNSSLVFLSTSLSDFDRLQFPLAFAVFSINPEMVELFANNGICIDQRDGRGNNIFHYLADLSRKNLDLAESCYIMLMDIIPKKKLHELIVQSSNSDHYNPIEYATHFGSIQFALRMIEQTLEEPVLVTDIDRAIISADEEGNYISEDGSGKEIRKFAASCSSILLDTPNKPQWTEKRMNVATYEAVHRNGQCSFFLNILFSRSPVNLVESELTYVNKNQCLQKWMQQKLKHWRSIIIIVGLVEIAISLVLTLGVLQSTQGDFNLTPNKDKFVNIHTQVFLGLWRNSDPTDRYYNLSQTFFGEYHDIETALSEGTDKMDYVELNGLINDLSGYSNFDSSDMTSLYEDYCVTGSVFLLVGDLVSIDKCTKMAADTLLVSCKETGSAYGNVFVVHNESTIYEYVLATSFDTQIYTSKISIYRNTLRVELGRTEAYAMLLIVLTYCCIYLFLDIFSRLRSLFQQLKYNISFYFLFATPIEGSYVKGQANCFSLFAYVLIVSYYWSSLASFYGNFDNEEVTLRDQFLLYDRTTADYITVNTTMCFFFVALFVFRIILHLNLFKLIPWVGKFIITTFELTVDLLHFTVVYVVIVFFFASLFHFVARSEGCPDRRDEAHYFVYDSIFSTFGLTFGHVDFEFQNVAVKMAYLLFVVMSIILLLNLIIALMGTTASSITNEPWLSYLTMQAYMQECLGLASWTSRAFGCMKVHISSLRRAGFVVKEDKESDSGFQVYVQAFQPSNSK